MSKVTYPIFKVADRIFFKAEENYVLLDTGFLYSIAFNGKFSVAVNGKIGPFGVGFAPKELLDKFINLTMPNGSKVKAILSPMDGFNCLLTPDGITVSDENEAIPEHDYFLPFVDSMHPIVEGSMNGMSIRFLFDSGARMTMFGETELTGGRPSTGSYTEWMGALCQNATLSVYDVSLDFPCGLHYEGKSAFVKNREYLMAGQRIGIRAMLGIDVFNEFDLYVSTANRQRGIALKKR